MSQKIIAPPMVYISGQEMTRYAMECILDKWIKPHVDIEAWKFFDLSAKNRDDTKDQVLQDAVDAGKDVKAIFKEPTVTPTEEQAKEWGLSKAWGSPNGAMRRGWNGITISRDTIHIPGIELGYKDPVLFERQAVGGEYGGGWKEVGPGKVTTTFEPADGGPVATVDERELPGERNTVVTYHNPLDPVQDLAHHFFDRALDAEVTPYVVTKKTVFKWQEPFWEIMKEVFDEHYKERFAEKGLLEQTGGELQHIISDAAAMDLVKWKEGGFAMAAHNYDGDMLTDLMSQVHRSPGFISSALIGRTDDGVTIKEFEASHGTVTDMDKARLKGKETSLNPLGLTHALVEAMRYSAHLAGGEVEQQVQKFTGMLREALYGLMAEGKATRDLAGPDGLTTEGFIEAVAAVLSRRLGKNGAIIDGNGGGVSR